jgi:hypothetical protein
MEGAKSQEPKQKGRQTAWKGERHAILLAQYGCDYKQDREDVIKNCELPLRSQNLHLFTSQFDGATRVAKTVSPTRYLRTSTPHSEVIL